MNLREELNKLDHKALNEETEFYDLVSLYEGCILSDTEKKKLAESIEKGNAKECYNTLSKNFNKNNPEEDFSDDIIIGEGTIPRNAKKITATSKYFNDGKPLSLTKSGSIWRDKYEKGYDQSFLRNHFDITVDETDPDYKPKRTKKEYVVQGDYGYGWDDLTTHDTMEDAKEDYRDYEENENVPHRIIARRVPIDESLDKPSGHYVIYYDYTDEEGNEYKNNQEEFTGSHLELMDYIKDMRKNDCYNIDASYVEDSVDESLTEERISASKFMNNTPTKEWTWDSWGNGRYRVLHHKTPYVEADVWADWRKKGRYVLDRVEGKRVDEGGLTRAEVQKRILSVAQTIDESLKESANEEKPNDFAQVKGALKELTNNFTEQSGSIQTGFEEEKRFAIEALKQYYKYVESSYDDREEVIRPYVITYSTPIKRDAKKRRIKRSI